MLRYPCNYDIPLQFDFEYLSISVLPSGYVFDDIGCIIRNNDNGYFIRSFMRIFESAFGGISVSFVNVKSNFYNLSIIFGFTITYAIIDNLLYPTYGYVQ